MPVLRKFVHSRIFLLYMNKCGVMGSADFVCWVATLVLGDIIKIGRGHDATASHFAAPGALAALIYIYGT